MIAYTQYCKWDKAGLVDVDRDIVLFIPVIVEGLIFVWWLQQFVSVVSFAMLSHYSSFYSLYHHY